MDLTTLVAALVPLSFLVFWVTALIKDITNGNWNGVLTRLTSFIGAFVIVSLFAHSSLKLGDTNVLSNLAWPDLVLIALAIAALGGSFADYLRARNPADASVQPTLLPSAAPPDVP